MGYEAIDASGGAQLKRQGKLLGVLPAGYRKENGAIIEDPITGPIVREIFHLHASGKHSMRSLADDLNRRGVRTPRNLGRGHNRPAAVIYTDGVLKDLLNNPSYLGKIRLDGELVDGAHPALVDQETFDRCQAIRTRNSKRMKRTFTRYHYPLAPVLVCGHCGGKMYGEAQGSGGTGPIRLYYGCSNRRKRLARIPNDKCEAPWIRAAELETALREELARCLPDANVNAALRDGLRRGLQKAASPRKVTETAIKRLEEQLARVQRLYEFGEYNWKTFIVKRASIREEEQRLREQADVHKQDDDLEWCDRQILDLIQVWDLADSSQRARMVAGIFTEIEANTLANGQVNLVAVPRPSWKPFFERVVATRTQAENQRETRLELSVECGSSELPTRTVD